MTSQPPRGLAERLRDTRAKLESDVDLWVATSGFPGGGHLIPLSYLWDGTAFLISTPRASITSRNLLADGRVRLSLGPTRDVVIVERHHDGERRTRRGKGKPAAARRGLGAT